MQFQLNEILSLHYLNHSDPNTIKFDDPALEEKAVFGRACRMKFLGDYYVILDQFSGHNYFYHERYIEACGKFIDEKEENNPYPLQLEIIKDALEQQINFSSKIPAFPDGKEKMLPYLTDEEAVSVKQWLENLETEFGAVHEIKPAYEVILEDDSRVQKLKQIKENFEIYMSERGYSLDKPVVV